jgi:hypothetical protein
VHRGAASAAKDVAEDVGKIEACRTGTERVAAAHAALECSVAVLVISGTLLRIA